MTEKIIFNDQFNWEDKFLYVSSPASKSKKKFIQKENCIENLVFQVDFICAIKFKFFCTR